MGKSVNVVCIIAPSYVGRSFEKRVAPGYVLELLSNMFVRKLHIKSQ